MNRAQSTSDLLIILCIFLFSCGLFANELLYKPEDNVEELDFATLETKLNESTAAKLVKFYNGFCEDTQKFIPAFRNLSRKLYKWIRILKVHVLDCSQDTNHKICRSFDIRNTPTLRYFPPNYTRKPDDLGTEITSRNVKEIASTLALNLQTLKYFNMLKREDNVTHIFENYKYVKYVALVFQMCMTNFYPHFETGHSMEEKYAHLDDCNDENPVISAIGRNTLLALLRYDEIVVRVFDDHDIYNNFGISPVPNLLILVNRAGKMLFLTPEMDSSEAYVAAIEQFLKFMDYKPQSPLPKTLPADINAALRYEIFEQLKHQPHRVFRADLEIAIDHILNVELLKTSLFVGKKLTVLRNFLRLLNYISPLRPEAKEKIKSLYYAMRVKKKLSGVELKNLIWKSFKDYKFPGKLYIGCIASRPFLRGFDCSLWTLFHYLTVESGHIDAGSVLLVFQGYVKFFMECKECRKKFKQFETLRPFADISNKDAQILWLWEAHNNINRQLAGGSTEDPKFPKIQFPSKKDCPSCRDHQSKWRMDEVLKYLKHIYCQENLSWFGMASANAYTS
ncbi:LOW QUALITY PROTEIN: sulfhydryl oxidase 1 [Drosophila rhopaloa]|uniref:Sulfhydryl oxidase n=1 Tax=Drosophila rhopaloa TaxID=1041015 RepID=A0ABM5HC27_DRORH|nr:LOW QUALITY PROTEIN: sulfhydryl oxidase 1 [Drosophila rhopaloa]